MTDVRTYTDKAKLAQAAADCALECYRASVADHGDFAIALSGGSTPRTLFQLLASPACARQIDWPKVHVFWGDERTVPPDHADSNYRMAKEALFDHVPQLDTWRITLTFPVINNAAHVVFLVSGTGKAARLKAVLEGPRQPRDLPSQRVQPVHGDLVWLADQDAAAQLAEAT